MKSCQCGCPYQRLIITEEETIVCPDCGTERQGPLTLTPSHSSFIQTHHVMQDTTYSRSKRFLAIMGCVVLGGASVCDNKMLKYLHSQKEGYWGFADVLACVKNSPLRDKRYNSLHLFNRVFADDYVAPKTIKDWFVFRKRMSFFFRGSGIRSCPAVS